MYKIIIFGLTLTVLFLSGCQSSCEDCYELEGYFSKIKGSHIVIDNTEYFISDWFTPNRGMPSYIHNYVNHTVHIDYVAGCGRRMITDIRIID